MLPISEVVKKFELYVNGPPHTIKGKITKSVVKGQPQFTWHISHNYKPTAGAGVYYPSLITVSSLEEAETLFQIYAQSFVTDHEVKANEYF
jgi:hypothetical protein